MESGGTVEGRGEREVIGGDLSMGKQRTRKYVHCRRRKYRVALDIVVRGRN